MKKTRLTVLALLAASLAVPMFQSYAMVPLPESLRSVKEREKAKPADPNTTVIESGTNAYFLPTHPLTGIAYFLPTHPPSLAVFLPPHLSAGLA
jgi:hypothetical protein